MIDVATTVTAVTVYPDRARVARRGAVSLEAGAHRLAVLELPLVLDPASVRATASATAPARLLGLEVRREFFENTPVAQVRELEEQLEALQDELVSLETEHALLKEHRAAVQGLAGATEIYARGLAYGKTTAAEQLTLLDDLQERAADLDEALLEVVVQRRDLKRRIDKAQGELKQLQGARGRERYSAVVEVELAQAGELTLELFYVVSRAGWTPLYDLRLLEAEGQPPALEVGYLAQVTQQTGEDWADAGLTLSTARPALSETLPELNPWYIAQLMPPPAPVSGARMMKRAAMPAAATVDFADAEAKEEFAPQSMLAAQVVTATVESSGAAVTYKVPGAVSIPADGAPHKVTVALFSLEPELDYVTAPKLAEAVYRRAAVQNDSPYTLLAGKANLFAGEEFIGATALELVAPGGEFELYLGVDDRIKVARELKRRDVDKKFIGDRRRLRYAYEIELANWLPAPAKITLHDQIPVSRNEQIKVKLESAEPKPAEETELGLLKWELTLASREERTLRFDFSVEHPRDMQVTGLP